MTPTQRRTMLATRLSILLPPREVEQPAEDGKPARRVALDWTPADVSTLLRLEGASEAKLGGLERMAAEAEALGGREAMTGALTAAGRTDVEGKPLAWLVTRCRALRE